jgi:hypothetical protein
MQMHPKINAQSEFLTTRLHEREEGGCYTAGSP